MELKKVFFIILLLFVITTIVLIIKGKHLTEGDTKILVEANQVGDTIWTVYEVMDMNFTNPIDGPKLYWKPASSPFKEEQDAILFEKEIQQKNDSLKLREFRDVSKND